MDVVKSPQEQLYEQAMVAICEQLVSRKVLITGTTGALYRAAQASLGRIQAR